MNKDFIKNIYNTGTNNTKYLLSWYNDTDENIYIIELCDYLISINYLLKSKNYCILKSYIDKEEYLSGFLFKKNETNYLITGSWNGYVRIWDLDAKEQINYLDTNNCELYNIILWSNRYAIISYKFGDQIKILDIKYFEIISKFKSEHFNGIKCIKKVIHPLFGESLLTCSEKGDIKLFILDEI
jgi:WD40 repeat protein